MELDPDAVKLLAQIHAPGRRGYEEMTPKEARESFAAMRANGMLAPEPVDETRELAAHGPHGPIPLRYYRPKGAGGAKLPVLVYAHGGGWVLGDLPAIEPTCTRLANRSGCAVVSVDYRLAPEHKFPVPADDTYAATAWVAANAANLNVDPNRLAVGGESAGATLAAVTCLMAREKRGPKIKYQVLVYPVTDFTMSTPSQRRFAHGHLLTGPSLRWFIGHYTRTGEDISDWRAAPLNASNLANLPPAFVLTAGFDPLRDEGEIYARRLAEEAGVPVTLWRAESQIHGFFSLGKFIPAADAAQEMVARHLKLALA